MNKRFAAIFSFLLILTGTYSFIEYKQNADLSSVIDPDQVVVAFVTYNDHGNNLYLDNLTLGARPNTVDLSVTAIDNIPPGTYITPGPEDLTIPPMVHVTNLGTQQSPDSQYVFFLMSNGYKDSVVLGPLTAGKDSLIQFDSAVITPGSSLNIISYVRVTGDTLGYKKSTRLKSVV